METIKKLNGLLGKMLDDADCAPTSNGLSMETQERLRRCCWLASCVNGAGCFFRAYERKIKGAKCPKCSKEIKWSKLTEEQIEQAILKRSL